MQTFFARRYMGIAGFTCSDSQQCETEVLALTRAMICSIVEGSNTAAATAHQNSITSCLLSQLNTLTQGPASFFSKNCELSGCSFVWLNRFHRRPFQNGSAWILTSNTSDPLNKSNTRGKNQEHQ